MTNSLLSRFWLNAYQQLLFIIAVALCCTGILYLLAANWFYFPHWLQLYIPQGVLLLSAVATYIYHPTTLKGHCAAICAAIMTGLSLATYGQIYQTGADSYELFLAWSLLIIPWLYYRLSSVYILLCITLLLSLFLAQEQLFFWSINSLFLFVSALLLVQLIIAQLWFKATRFTLLLIVGGVACFTLQYTNNSFLVASDSWNLWWIPSFILPLLVTLIFYLRRWELGLATGTFILAITSSFYTIEKIFNSGFDGTEALFFISLILFLWGFTISKLLKWLLTKHSQLILLPAALGAWLSSFFLIAAILELLDYYDGLQPSLIYILCILFIIIGAVLLKISQATFIRQLAYSLLISAQLGLFTELYTEELFLAFHLGLIVVFTFISASSFWRSAQLSLALLHLYYYYPTLILWSALIPLVIFHFFPQFIEKKEIFRPACVSILTAVFAYCLLQTNEYTFFYPYSNYNELLKRLSDQYVMQFTFGVLMIIGLLLYSSLFSRRTQITLIVSALALIELQRYDILLLLVLLALIVYRQDNLLKYLSLLLLAVCLWITYYNLAFPLFLKGLTIIGSGLIVAVMSKFLLPLSIPQQEEIE